jgi:hypothetical protein
VAGDDKHWGYIGKMKDYLLANKLCRKLNEDVTLLTAHVRH